MAQRKGRFERSGCGRAGTGRRDLGNAGASVLLGAATERKEVWACATRSLQGCVAVGEVGMDVGKREGERGGHASAHSAA